MNRPLCPHTSSAELQYLQAEREVSYLSRTVRGKTVGSVVIFLLFSKAELPYVIRLFKGTLPSVWKNYMFQLAGIRPALSPLPPGEEGCLHHNPRLQYGNEASNHSTALCESDQSNAFFYYIRFFSHCYIFFFLLIRFFYFPLKVNLLCYCLSTYFCKKVKNI